MTWVVSELQAGGTGLRPPVADVAGEIHGRSSRKQLSEAWDKKGMIAAGGTPQGSGAGGMVGGHSTTSKVGDINLCTPPSTTMRRTWRRGVEADQTGTTAQGQPP